jgi:hypothetical protein
MPAPVFIDEIAGSNLLAGYGHCFPGYVSHPLFFYQRSGTKLAISNYLPWDFIYNRIYVDCQGKSVLSNNFPRFLFSRSRASRTNRNYSCLLNYVKGKNHPISINLRFAVLARSNISTLLSYLQF